MGLMDKIPGGDKLKLAKQMMDAQKKLQSIKVTVEHKGVTVVMTADMKVVSISGDTNHENISEAVNEAIKQTQRVAAQEMAPLMGGLGIPGL